jgi:hypothetical protein
MTFRTRSADDQPADVYRAYIPAGVEPRNYERAHAGVRVPVAHAGTLDTAIAWARSQGATNLIVQTGPKSKPVDKLVWRQDAAPVTTIVVTTTDGRRWHVRPDLLAAA